MMARYLFLYVLIANVAISKGSEVGTPCSNGEDPNFEQVGDIKEAYSRNCGTSGPIQQSMMTIAAGLLQTKAKVTHPIAQEASMSLATAQKTVAHHPPGQKHQAEKSKGIESNREKLESNTAAEYSYPAAHHTDITALSVFKWWQQGRVAHRLATQISNEDLEAAGIAGIEVQEDAKMTANGMAQLLDNHRENGCPALLQGSSGVKLHDSHKDEKGVQHVLLKTPLGIQYVAEQSGLVLAADPLACPKPWPGLLEEEPEPTLERDKTAGSADLLDAKTDPLVQECVALFHRTVKENCQKDFTIDVMSATVQIIDGLEVKMMVSLTGPAGKVTKHSPMCDFEVEATPDAELLQQPNATEEVLPDEQNGMKATLRMEEDLCTADEKDGVDDIDAQALDFMQHFGMGDLSRYKGHDHVRDMYEPMDLSQIDNQQSQYGMMDAFPQCFPNSGVETVRSQGQCGSCWAFACATSLMHNLCVSGKGQHAMASSTDRYEVSVQGVMSCDAKQQGCNGGTYHGADQAWTKVGITKERDFKYKCGGGSSLNHFEQGNSCKSFPWGSSCQAKKESNWNYLGFGVVMGEAGIRKIAAMGLAQFISLDVYSNFMTHKSGVYNSITGGKKGAHAVSLIGYGEESGEKYWQIQNSWGTNWGESGFAKVLRGSNLAGIEEFVALIKGYVTGGTKPACFDAVQSGLSGGNGDVPCSQVTALSFCKHARFGSLVTNNCPVSCKKPGCGTRSRSRSRQPLDSSPGANGVNNMGECQGDCDKDSDCAGDLTCFQRGGFTAVPGCSGAGTKDWDYCIVSQPDETLKGDRGSGYRGEQTKTRSGRTCQNWDKQSPQKHGNSPEKKPKAGLTKNYCRNPDAGDTIWCYTTDAAKRWEYCDPTTTTRTLPPLDSSPGANGGMGECQGDCDKDSDCAGDLTCFQRGGFTAVPGCSGAGTKDWDYCISPSNAR